MLGCAPFYANTTPKPGAAADFGTLREGVPETNLPQIPRDACVTEKMRAWECQWTFS